MAGADFQIRWDEQFMVNVASENKNMKKIKNVAFCKKQKKNQTLQLLVFCLFSMLCLCTKIIFKTYVYSFEKIKFMIKK